MTIEEYREVEAKRKWKANCGEKILEAGMKMKDAGFFLKRNDNERYTRSLYDTQRLIDELIEDNNARHYD